MYMYNVSQKANISEIVILQMLGEMNLKNKKMIAGFFLLKKTYKEKTVSVSSYCDFVIYWVGKTLDNHIFNKLSSRTKIIICHIVNFVFTPITKTYNEHFNLVGKCKTKINQYDVMQTFIYYLYLYICTPIQKIFF